MTTILFHASNSDDLELRLQDALALARASHGHLSIAHVTPAEAYVTFDAFGGVFVMSDVLDAIMQTERDVKDRVAAAMAHEDIPWDYSQLGGPLVPTLAARGSLADLMIVARQRPRGGHKGAQVGVIGDLLMDARSPIFIPGDRESPHDPLAPVLIGWNGSIQAASAVRGALPWLRLASGVSIVAVKPSDRDDDATAMFPSTRVLEYLSRHGVHAELHEVDEKAAYAAAVLVEKAGTIGAHTLVVGGYGHSRLGEYWLGGVTQVLLESCPMGMIVAH